jgi:ankyrin repeat protein
MSLLCNIYQGHTGAVRKLLAAVAAVERGGTSLEHPASATQVSGTNDSGLTLSRGTSLEHRTSATLVSGTGDSGLTLGARKGYLDICCLLLRRDRRDYQTLCRDDCELRTDPGPVQGDGGGGGGDGGGDGDDGGKEEEGAAVDEAMSHAVDAVERNDGALSNGADFAGVVPDVNHVTTEGLTALQFAVTQGRTRLVALLLDAGADPGTEVIQPHVTPPRSLNKRPL